MARRWNGIRPRATPCCGPRVESCWIANSIHCDMARLASSSGTGLSSPGETARRLSHRAPPIADWAPGASFSFAAKPRARKDAENHFFRVALALIQSFNASLTLLRQIWHLEPDDCGGTVSVRSLKFVSRR
ncbi:protein of unknown function [Methylocella tundrae]|uniref:Uncharacterized protein n=1 Tax=Methylocella tundrae TaxID=227605 RepID=A0A4U8Z4J4_METTU|nr:protein of unknown function [Methylocella tundrae]